MKTSLLFFLSLLTTLTFSQANIFQTIPAIGGANSAFRAPNGSSLHTSLRAHYIIPASELTGLPSGINITSVAFNLVSGTNAAASGNLKFYMENTTATSNTKSTVWNNAITGMDSVYDGSFTIPNTTGTAIAPISLSDTFNYTGGGIYIAYEYIGSTFGTVDAIYDCNNTIASSLQVVYNSTTTPDAILSSTSAWRPILTVSYTNPFTNDMTVDDLMIEMGHKNIVVDTNQTITGIVRNKSSVTLSSIPVTLTITGANPSISTQTISSLAAGSSDTLTFSNLSTSTGGAQTVKLTVPSDQFSPNDSIQLYQRVSCDSISHADNSIPYTAIGFNTGDGILAAKHTGSPVVNTSIKSIYVDVDASTNIVGQQLQAVLLDSGGTIIDSSSIIPMTYTRIGTRVTFSLTGNNLITTANPIYYLGIRQYADPLVGYFPLSALYPQNAPDDIYYSFDMDGSNRSAAYTTLGTLGIGAIIEVERNVLTNSDANDTICPGEMVTFTASGVGTSFYNFNNGTSSVQNTASNTYSTTINTTTSLTVEKQYNTCPVLSNTSTINVVVVNASASKTSDTTASSGTTGANYQWIDCATDMAIPGETSQIFTANVAGSYKVVVSQSGCSDTSECFSLTEAHYAGINENKIKSLKLYPSPTNAELMVETDNAIINNLTIMTVNGKIINSYTLNNKRKSLDVSNLSSGVYLLRVTTDKGQETMRFIKQ